MALFDHCWLLNFAIDYGVSIFITESLQCSQIAYVQAEVVTIIVEREMESTSSEFNNNLKKEWTDKSYIFIPVNKNQNHWVLLYGDVTKKSVYFSDPSPVDKPDTAASYLKIFVKCYETVFPKSRFKWKLQRCVYPYQNDAWNCGI